MADIPTGTVTFLFTDIEGSTALYENYRYKMQSARKRHDEILRSCIESHRGYVFKTVGDAFCAAFDTAREAIQAALAAQRTLLAEQWPENVELWVRMGLHSGVAEESEGDYFGPPVNRVARLMSTGHGGQILLSDATYNLVRDDLVYLESEAELGYLGEHRLKDLKNTERIFQLIVPDLPKEFPPLKTRGLVTPAEVVNLDRRYHRIRYIGGGGFGNVYLVRHEALERNIALKVLGQQLAQDEQFKERFRREAKSAAKLNHPNIVQVYDAGEGLFEGQKSSYITMEYVPGGTLEDLIAHQGGPLPARTATELTLQVAKALGAAHQSGVIHRDIKPQNILITESGEAKVADFGIARAAASSTRLTRTGLLMGTLHYISPEQANGQPASPQSDLYSLGVVLYQMLTGELPFDAETPAAVMVKHITEPAREPKEMNPEVPEGINAVCVRLLAKDPNERYPDATALMKNLERVKEAPQGVIGQEPLAGTKVEQDSSVSVTVSSGPEKATTVPDVSGRGVEEARPIFSSQPPQTLPTESTSDHQPPPQTLPVEGTADHQPQPEQAGAFLSGSQVQDQQSPRLRTGPAEQPPLLTIPSEGSPTRDRNRREWRRKVPRWVMVAAPVVVLALIGVFVVIWILGRDPQVPDVVGQTEDVAERLAGDDFEIDVSGTEVGDERKDTILSQDPEPGERAEQGSTVSVVLSAGQPPNPGDIFEDDFSSTSSGWRRDEDDEDGDTSDYADGGYGIQNLQSPSIRSLLANAGTIEDAIVEVDATATSDTPKDATQGIVCRHGDARTNPSYYVLGIFRDGRAVITKVKDGDISVLTRSNYSSAVRREEGATNHIRGDCVGNTLTLYVNDQKVLDANDTDLTSGRVGLFVATSPESSGADVLFDDFLVSSP